MLERCLWIPALLLILAFGCAEEDDRVDIRLSWQLADGRDCAEAGITHVTVTVTAASAASSQFDCEAGLEPAAVELGAFERGIVELKVEAISGSGESLYEASGRAELRDKLTTAHLELRFVGVE